MSIFIKEIKSGMKAFWIWTLSIIFMIIVCITLFPEMKGQMDDVTNMFSNMGGFTAAFGMDQLNFGEIMGFYSIECGNILGIGAAFFAAYLGVTIISKEEKEHTSEFLLTHPVTRNSVLTQKLLTVFTELLIMNLLITATSALSINMIGETLETKKFLLLHLAYFLLQIEIAGICFCISAFIKDGNIGIGIGIAAIFYFLDIIANISEQSEFITYITPFSYAKASDIITNTAINTKLLLLGMGYTVIAIILAFVKYNKKDIAA